MGRSETLHSDLLLATPSALLLMFQRWALIWMVASGSPLFFLISPALWEVFACARPQPAHITTLLDLWSDP